MYIKVSPTLYYLQLIKMIWARHILIISLALLSYSEAYDKKSIALKPLDFFNPTFKSLKNVDGESKVSTLQK